jgi:hypothetical protein
VAGDTIYLLKGKHERFVISYKYAKDVVFMSYPGDTAILSRATFTGASHVKLANVIVSRESQFLTPGLPVAKTISMDATSDHITVENCLVYSAFDPINFTQADWLKMDDGIYCMAPHCLITNNHIMNINVGSSVDGVGTVFSHNLVENIADDGLRTASDSVKIEYNIVRNLYVRDINHDDLFQCSSVNSGAGTVTAVEMRGNILLAMQLPIKYPKVVYGTDSVFDPYFNKWINLIGVPVVPQGIGNFNGFYKDWIVENNIIAVESAHGIAFYGALNCKILNNTVIESPANLSATDNFANIEIYSHKTRGLSKGNLVRGNFAKKIYCIFSDSNRATNADPSNVFDHNYTDPNPDYTKYFVDYMGYDFHLKPGAKCIGQGSDNGTPTIDLDGVTRTLPYDAGCYNYNAEKPSAVKEVFMNNGAKLTVDNAHLLVENINGETTVRIFDTNGRTVATKTTNQNSLEFALNNKGLYILFKFNRVQINQVRKSFFNYNSLGDSKSPRELYLKS